MRYMGEEYIEMKEVWKLFYVFFRIGISTFGGGYAMLPVIQKEIVDKREWIKEEEVTDYYAIGQCTPGIIAVNTATMIGYKQKGIFGGIAATLGMVFPSLIIIMVIATFFQKYQDYEMVQHALAGIQVAVIALILHIVYKMWQGSIDDYFGVFIFFVSFIFLAYFNLSPVFVILGSAFLGVFSIKVRLR